MGEDDGDFGLKERCADEVGELEAGGDEGGLGGVPGDGLPGFDFAGVGEGGGEEVDAGAAGGGVDEEAGGGAGVVGEAGALVGGDGVGGVGVAWGDDVEAGCGEGGAELGGEGEGEVFLEDVVGELGSGVGASVGGVEEDEVAVRWWVEGSGSLGVEGDAQDEGGCGFEDWWAGWGHG